MDCPSAGWGEEGYPAVLRQQRLSCQPPGCRIPASLRLCSKDSVHNGTRPRSTSWRGALSRADPAGRLAVRERIPGYRPAPHPADGRPAGGGRGAADAAAAYPRSQVRPAAQHAAAVCSARSRVRDRRIQGRARTITRPGITTCARIRMRSRSRSAAGASRSARARPKAPSVRNYGGWSMTITTATRCTSSGRASGSSR